MTDEQLTELAATKELREATVEFGWKYREEWLRFERDNSKEYKRLVAALEAVGVEVKG